MSDINRVESTLRIQTHPAEPAAEARSRPTAHPSNRPQNAPRATDGDNHSGNPCSDRRSAHNYKRQISKCGCRTKRRLLNAALIQGYTSDPSVGGVLLRFDDFDQVVASLADEWLLAQGAI